MTIRYAALGKSLAIATIALLSTSVYAQKEFTLVPNPSDIGDLDHHSLYTWRMNNVDLTGQTITEATLTFKNIHNWKANEANVLHLHLLDTAVYSGVKSFLDDDPTNDPQGGGVTDLTDDFIDTRYHNGTNAVGKAAPLACRGGYKRHLSCRPVV